MAGLNDEIEIVVRKEGDLWRNVDVGEVYLDKYAHEWKIPVTLVLAPNNVYSDEVLIDDKTLYRFSYKIGFQPTADQYAEVVYAKTTYPDAYPQKGETPFFHIFPPMYEAWPVRGMRGEVRLSSEYAPGTAFQLTLKEGDWELLSESYVEEAEQTVYLGEAKGKFIVSLSDDFFEHKYIWWWGEEQTVHCYECTLGLVPGIVATPVTVPNILAPPIKKAVKQGEVAEFTSADGLVEGKIYVFGIDFFHAVDQAVNGLAYKFDNTAKNIFLVPVPGIGNAICPLLGIEPETTECTMAIAEFIDPIYVANVFSKVIYHKDIAGNAAEANSIDYIFVPIALLSGVAPVGGVGKKVIGPILKNIKKAGLVDNWLEESKSLIQAALVKGNDIDAAVALDRVKSAAEAVEGSAHQKGLLDEATRILDNMILDSKLTGEETIQKQKFFVEEITKKLDDVKSKTPADEVVKKSGLEDAAHVVPGIRSLDSRKTSIFKRVIEKLFGKKPLRQEIEGQLCELSSISINEGGHMTQSWRPLATGFVGKLKEHKLAASLLSAALILFPWWFADNFVFLIYVLRYAKVLEATWGVQWDNAEEAMEDAYWDMQNFGVCNKEYQQCYLNGIADMRRLLEGANPIPEDKLAKAKYNLEVCYAVRIGDPNEYVKEKAWDVLEAKELTYTKLVMGCEDPLLPPEGLKIPVIPNPVYRAKIERVVDGDTFDVSSNDPTWPYEEDYPVRLLGVDTPDKDGAGYYSVRRKAIPDGDAEEDPVLDVQLEDYQRATRAAQLIIEKQEVLLRIDLNNQYDTTPGKRILATIWVDRPATVIDGVTITEAYTGDFGEKQLAEGNACVFFYSPNSIFGSGKRTTYKNIEANAKRDKKGIWGTTGPSMPKGKIHCRSAPGSAWVYLDDVTAPKGDTEMTISDVRIGAHTVHFRGTAACPYCSCDFDVIVEEDKTVEAFCELSAVYEIAEVYWIDGDGIKQTMSAYVDPAAYLNQTSNVSDGCAMKSICIHPPGDIVFGRAYTTVTDSTPLKVQNCAAATLLDLDFGKRRIELRQSGFKTMYDVLDIKHGMHETRTAAMVKGDEEVYIKLGGAGPGKLHVKVYDGIDTLNYVKAMLSLRNYQGAEVGRAESVYEKTFSDLNAGPEHNPHTLTVTAEGFDIYTEDVTIASGSTTDLTVYLTGAAGVEVGGEGTLHVIIRDDEERDTYVSAKVSVKDKDGIAAGKSPTSYDTKMKLPVAGSPFTLQITHDAYNTYTKSSIEIKKDSETDVNAYLIPLGLQPPGTAILYIQKPHYMRAGIEEPLHNAEVFIDYGTDKVLEDTFTEVKSTLSFTVDLGMHTIKLRAGRFNDRDIIIEILGDHLTASWEMTSIYAATIIDPSTYPKEFNIGYTQQCPITIVNASDFDETFVVSQIFDGIDVIYTMVFPSERILVNAGAERTVSIPVTIPGEAIPTGMNVANYAIRARLEVV
jgi:endonuclease YncB( thermonuclease family)